MDVREILLYMPPRPKPIKSLDPRLSTVRKALQDVQTQGDYRLFICDEATTKDELEAIANTALFHDFRMLATTRLALLKLKSFNWIRTKPRKLIKLTPDSLNVIKPVFETWFREVLIKALSTQQLNYLLRKSKTDTYKQDIELEIQHRQNEDI